MGEQLVLIEQDGPTTQKEAFIHYVEGMELDMIDALLEKDKYMEVEKA